MGLSLCQSAKLKAILTSMFIELPSEFHPSVVGPLAVPCSLHGIESFSESFGWLPLDVQLVKKHLYHQKVVRTHNVCAHACSCSLIPMFHSLNYNIAR